MGQESRGGGEMVFLDAGCVLVDHQQGYNIVYRALHQGSELSSLLFSVAMDVVSSEPRSDKHPLSCMLITEFLWCKRLRNFVYMRISLTEKGLNMNAAKSKVMVCSNDGKMTVTHLKIVLMVVRKHACVFVIWNS